MELIMWFSEIPPDLLEFFEPVDAPVDAPDVQKWSAEPLHAQHFAAFPTALARWCLLCGTSAKGYCPACGKPWCRVMEATEYYGSAVDHSEDAEVGKHQWRSAEAAIQRPPQTIGWRPSCSCSPVQEPRPALVLDPFAGSGRTGLTAQRMGLDFVGCELNEQYVQMARRLLHEDAPLFAQPGNEVSHE